MQEEIKSYLSNAERTYTEGVMLFGRFSPNKQLARLFAVKENAYNKEKLEYELRKIAELKIEDVAPIAPLVTEIIDPIATAIVTDPNKDNEDELNQWAIDLKNLYVQRCQLSNQLADLPEGPELEAKVKEILAKKEEYNALREKYNALANGKPLEEEEGDTDAEKKIAKEIDPQLAVLNSKLKPLREKRSKTKDKIAKSPNHAKLKTWQTELAQTEADIEELERQKKMLEAGN